MKRIEVHADWVGLGGPTTVGVLHTDIVRGAEVFAFEYERAWLDRGLRTLDPALGLWTGRQYAPTDNFGVFLDSCPDRWGRVLMQRREVLRARHDGRRPAHLHESDYLLGVHDGHRMGGLRFRTDGAFLDDDDRHAAPPWTSLGDLQRAAQGVEAGDDRWIHMLIAPGSSLGGARPKASVLDEEGQLWIAKFPSRSDDHDVGAWELLVHALAGRAGLDVPEARSERFGDHATFLTRRFDRGAEGRVHFCSAMTLLERRDGEGASYLELAEVLKQHGAATNRDLAQLWRRIAFNICVSNTDDHLRNHGFLLTEEGWRLSPAYDMNPVPWAGGLSLNLDEVDNRQDLGLLREIAPQFRIRNPLSVLAEVVEAVRSWPELAADRPRSERERMARAFAVADDPL